MGDAVNDEDWLTSFDAATTAARNLRRPLFVDFWDPTCLGCAKMIATTFPDQEVARILHDHFVCLKINTADVAEDCRGFVRRYRVAWTPDFIFLDAYGGEMNRRLGYHPPSDFLAVLNIARGLSAMSHREYLTAFELFNAAIDVGPDPVFVPEALFWRGIAAFKVAKSDRAVLRKHWTVLRDQYSDTVWWTRADASWGVEDPAATPD